jgi:ribosomal RNA-processing protein 1
MVGLLSTLSSPTNTPRDRPTRDKALESLKTFLSGRRELPALELLKLWKGLFYCLWMSDRPIPQQNLCTSLASLISILPSETVIPFLRAFWQTMQREWTNIDVLRMEKFLLLVRRYVGASFEQLKKGGWQEDEVREMKELWGEVPLNVEDLRIPNGIRFHVLDLWIDELEKVGVLEEGNERLLESLLEPVRNLTKDSPTKAVRKKAKEALGDERLPGNEKVEEEKVEDGWGGIQD